MAAVNDLPPQWQPPREPNMGKQAASGFLSGFAGCLGVGLAILFVILVLLLFAAPCGHSG